MRTRLVWVCDMVDLKDIVENPKVLSRIIGKMKHRRQIYETRIQMGDFNGEPRKVVSLYKMYAPAHDNALTKVMKALGWPEAETPPNIESVGEGDEKVRPDAVTIFPRPRLWEMDMATEREDEIKKKVKAFAKQKNAVLWVCPTEARRQKLIGWTKEIHHISFYALWHELIRDPHGPVWMTGPGKKESLSFVKKDVATEATKEVANG